MDDVVGLIPAAGGGTRLYPFSRAVPKEMYPILGKAVIEHSIENLKVGGVKNIYMIVGYQKGAIMDYIGDGSFFGVNVLYAYQMQRKGLGHAIYQAKNWINKTFVTLLGDSFIEPKEEISDLINFHKEKKPVATVLLFEVDDPTGYGVVKFRNLEDGYGLLEGLKEKPDPAEAKNFENRGKYYALCGAYVFEPRIFDYIEKTKPDVRKEIQITDAISLALQNGEKVYGVILKGKYIDIGKWKTVLKTEKDLLRNLDVDKCVVERERMVEKIKKHEEENGR